MIDKTTSFFKRIRWQNLAIIFVTLWLVKSCLIQSQLDFYNLQYPLTNLQLFYLSLSAMLVAAAGYIINDLHDIATDSYNKPKLMVDSIFSEAQLMRNYYIFNGISLIPTLVVFKGFTLLVVLSIQLLVIFGLYVYTKHLKGAGLAGNLLISIFSSLFPIGLWFVLFLHPSYSLLPCELKQNIFILVVFYSAFAFLLSLTREIVKDMEDKDGDRFAGIHTFAVNLPEKTVKNRIFWLLVLTMALIIVFQIFLKEIGYLGYSASFSVQYILYFLFIFPALKKAKTTKDYYQISSWLKISMLVGILLMLQLLII